MKELKKDKPETTKEELREEPQKDEAVQKGYNEKNPHQSQGAFFPDSRSADKNKSDEDQQE